MQTAPAKRRSSNSGKQEPSPAAFVWPTLVFPVSSCSRCFSSARRWCSCIRAQVRAGLGRLPAASAPHAVFTRRRCCQTARCWRQAAPSLTAALTPCSPARNYTIRRAGPGRRPETSLTPAPNNRRRCYLTARCSSQAAILVLAAAAVLAQARNSTIRQPGPGRSRAALKAPVHVI